jgi:HEAT repeat protein
VTEPRANSHFCFALVGGLAAALFAGWIALRLQPAEGVALERSLAPARLSPQTKGAATRTTKVVAPAALEPVSARAEAAEPSELSEAELELDAPINTLVRAALRADDPSVREYLIHALRFRAGEDATDAIVAFLGDSAPEVRLAAAESLEARADRRSLFALAALVDDEEDLEVEGALRRAILKMAP